MRKATTRHSSGRVRIIGGQWRGRKLDVPDAPGLRPTPDRVRETLFNWLAGRIQGAHCLDLFAGSGVLGLEALSRGAGYCDFVDISRSATDGIRKHLALLDVESCAAVHCQSGLQWQGGPADIVFLDPPFTADLLAASLNHLENTGLLAPGARIYVEMGSEQKPPVLPASMAVLRDKTAGGVRYLLLAAED
jgi:16S rRNA (guanine966-N2)-methyltransferase